MKNYDEVKRYFDHMPVAFTIIEVGLNDKGQPVDFVFRYANPSLAELEEVPLEQLIGMNFYQEVFGDKSDVKWLQYYCSSAYHDEVHEIHDYSPEIGKYLKIISYPWDEPGCCACLLFDESELVEARKRLEFLAGYDETTHFKNRNALEVFSRSFSGKGSTGVIFVDINHLKKTNDRFGHTTGDFLIDLVKEKIKNVFVDARDQVFRFGGDEFVIILQETDRDSVKMKAEALREQFANHSIRHLPAVLASAGWSWEESSVSLEELIEKADREMYKEKRSMAEKG